MPALSHLLSSIFTFLTLRFVIFFILIKYRYSLGLLFWEVYNCLSLNGVSNLHQLPFGDVVGEDVPETMTYELRKLVCEQGQRPEWNERFGAITILNKVQNLIRECWFQNPSSRVPVLHVKFQVEALLGSIQSEENFEK